MSMPWLELVIGGKLAVGLGSCQFLLQISVISFSSQDCAGAILYSTEKAVEVALEGMQCFGGNGYINGMDAKERAWATSH